VDDPQGVWRALVNEVRVQKKDMLASSLAHARVIHLGSGAARLGYGPQDGMYRRQAERNVKEVEAVLLRMLGGPTSLSFESISAQEALLSMAEEDNERAKVREETLTRKSRESTPVLSAMRILGGTIEQVRVLDDEQESEFVPAPEEGEEGREET
jgi:hypothetical protein